MGRRGRGLSGRGANPEQVPPHLAPGALASAVGHRGPAARGEESPSPRRSGSLGPAGASCPREGPWGALAGFPPPCPDSRWLSPLPLASPPGSGNLFWDFSAVLLRILLGQARLLEAGQPSRKENKLGTE